MALTEIQLMTKEEFYSRIRNLATNLENLLVQTRQVSEFIGWMGTADMDAMGLAIGAARTDLANFRTCLLEILDFYDNGGPITATNTPAEIIDKIRKMG